METQDIQSDLVKQNGALEPITKKTRNLNTFLGLIVGTITYFSIALIFLFNCSTCDMEAPMGVLCGSLFYTVSSAAGGLLGGDIGFNKGHPYLGAILGGLLFPIIVWGIVILLVFLFKVITPPPLT